MDEKALFKLSYGLFVLTGKSGDKANGCIINTCNQVASNPARLAISVINGNYTCDLIKESGVFALSVLDETTSFETIRHWGMQSGRNVDKMKGIDLPVDTNAVPYLSWSTCAVFSCRVTEKIDLGSHTLFIGEIVDSMVTGNGKPVTYADYHAKIKPKNETVKPGRKIKAWRCRICGFIYEGTELPEDYLCPLCGHPKEDFEPIYED